MQSLFVVAAWSLILTDRTQYGAVGCRVAGLQRGIRSPALPRTLALHSAAPHRAYGHQAELEMLYEIQINLLQFT